MSSKEVLFNFENVKLKVEEYDGYVYLDSIVVNEDFRNKGLGTEALKEVIRYADEVNKPLLMFVSNELGGDVEKLEKWYKSHGFYEEHNVINADYNYNFRKDPSKPEFLSIGSYKVGQEYQLDEVKKSINNNFDLSIDLSRPHQIAVRSESIMDDVVTVFYVEENKAKCIFNIFDSKS